MSCPNFEKYRPFPNCFVLGPTGPTGPSGGPTGATARCNKSSIYIFKW